MTKEEFLNRIENEKLNIGEYIIILDKISNASLVLGCAFDEGKWKVYKTRERGGHYIIKEFVNEHEAFDYFYKLDIAKKFWWKLLKLLLAFCRQQLFKIHF